MAAPKAIPALQPESRLRREAKGTKGITGALTPRHASRSWPLSKPEFVNKALIIGNELLGFGGRLLKGGEEVMKFSSKDTDVEKN